MPTYEYACMSCGRHIEVVQSFSDEPLRICEVCGGPLKKVFHPVGIVLKGSGFYSTDNRSSRSKIASPSEKSEKKDTSSDSKGSESSSAESSSADKKSEAKPSSSSKKSDGGSSKS